MTMSEGGRQREAERQRGRGKDPISAFPFDAVIVWSRLLRTRGKILFGIRRITYFATSNHKSTPKTKTMDNTTRIGGKARNDNNDP